MTEQVLVPRYVVITPVRNEQENLPRTIVSMAQQTVRAWKWVIVDDGSTDATGRIADEARAQYPWIEVVHRRDRGFRKPGGGVVEAFREGYQLVESTRWDFIVKLDGDLSFEPDYFAAVFNHFVQNPRLGITGGTICKLDGGALVPESIGDPRFHVRGATKIYRADCWQQLGGLYPAPGWDTLDEIKANMLGWTTCTLAGLKLHHHRHAGEADGKWVNWFKNGRANYITGYLPLFMLCKCLTRIFSKPYGIGALGLWCGYASGYLKRVPRINDPQLIRYLRREQLNRLLLKNSLWG
jgi:biofilm PGA synthesis N-glycosyltransferase PgaC